MQEIITGRGVSVRKQKTTRNPAEITIRLNMETLKAASGALITSLAKGGIAISSDKAMEVVSSILKSLKKGKE